MEQVKRYWHKGILRVLFFTIGLLFTFCGKDPVFEQGDYLYEHDDFTKVEDINGILLHWSDTMALSKEQKTVVRNLVANLVNVSGGTYRMGAQNSDPQSDNYYPEARDNENPVHEVTLSDFYLGRFEVTQREWRAIMGDDLDWSEQYGKGDDFPAYNVSRNDALRFLERLSAMTRLPFRLPTEAQWEYAAKGGSHSLPYRFSGSNQVDEVAWHIGNSNGVLHPVGGKLPNELGFCDMSGSLWELCSDTYGPYPSAPQTDPLADSGSQFVLRGGAWAYLPTYCRTTCRDAYDGDAASVSVGFRVAMGRLP